MKRRSNIHFVFALPYTLLECVRLTLDLIKIDDPLAFATLSCLFPNGQLLPSHMC